MLLGMGSLAQADSKSIQGTVIGAGGKPVAGAEVRANRVDDSGKALAGKSVTEKTSPNGQYTFANLPMGVYQVLVAINGVPKSQAKIKTRTDGYVRVDFDLRPGKSSIRTAQPSGRAENPAEDEIRRMQQNLGGTMNSMSFPGH